MAQKKKPVDPTHRALRPIKHDSDYYAVGDQIHLTDEQAEALGDKVVERISASSATADKDAN
jgi:hypothetical protein